MLDEDEYERWMATARITLESAINDLEGSFYNWTCFKAQQSAECAVKAILRGLGLPAYGHSISRLVYEVSGRGVEASHEVVQASKTLDKYYVPTRYPNVWAEGSPADYYTRMDAEESIRMAKLIMRWVEGAWRSLRRESREGLRP